MKKLIILAILLLSSCTEQQINKLTKHRLIFKIRLINCDGSEDIFFTEKYYKKNDAYVFINKRNKEYTEITGNVIIVEKKSLN